MHDSTISVVIPVYNGKDKMDGLIGRLRNTLGDFRDYEIILVDDSSPDGSFGKIKELATDSDDIKGILLDENYGQQSATLCGLRHSKMDYVVIMDDDLEHRPEDITVLYNEIISGYDVVYALNSDNTKTSALRKSGSWLRDSIFNIMTDKPRGIKVCSFRILNRKTADDVGKSDGRFVYISMEILKNTSNIGNIWVEYGKRTASGHTFSGLAGLILKIIIYYSRCRLFKMFTKSGPSYRIKFIVGKS